MNDSKNITRVKVFLKASSENELIQKQLKNNLINNMMYSYDTPQKIGKEFIVWFFADVTKYKVVE